MPSIQEVSSILRRFVPSTLLYKVLQYKKTFYGIGAVAVLCGGLLYGASLLGVYSPARQSAPVPEVIKQTDSELVVAVAEVQSALPELLSKQRAQEELLTQLRDAERALREDLVVLQKQVAQTAVKTSSVPSAERTPTTTASHAPNKLNVNTASKEQLDTLPGVGPKIASDIITERERRGGFTSVDQLLEVKGIGEALLEKIQDLVMVGET